MIGTHILISGRSGAGKTTLIRAALAAVPDLHYLHTATTRPPRPGEQDGLEYQFVDDAEYDRLRTGSAHWDHVEHQGYKYGTDVANVLAAIRSGGTMICALAPVPAIIEKMKQLSGGTAVTVWIDTPAEISAARIADDTLRSARQEDDSIKSTFQHVFSPSGDLVKDEAAFTQLITTIITK